jgi:endoglucanase
MNILPTIAKKRGFNLLEMFAHGMHKGAFIEEDFRWIAGWGFDFVRLPLSYWIWSDPSDPSILRQDKLEYVDRAVYWGQRFGIHVCINFHRVPGYCSNAKPVESTNLWKDTRVLYHFCHHWEVFSDRYRSIPPQDLSFNLVNEPPPVSELMSREDHERVIRAAFRVIKDSNPDRPVIVDGLQYGTKACTELRDLEIIHSCRSYIPLGISHYKADWVPMQSWPQPVWPGGAQENGEQWDRAALEAYYAPWGDLVRQGIPVHCGEGGAWRHTPHAVVLAWYRDVLELLKQHGIGHALWNFRGAFGILDSGRTDTVYEDWHGHKLDRKLLELLQEF